jgi:hypothetical protein
MNHSMFHLFLTRSINVSFGLWFLSSVVRMRDDGDKVTPAGVRYVFRDTFGQCILSFFHIS